MPGSENQEVFVRDTATGTTFGPFEPGTRVKYVGASGAKPSIKPMAANGSNNNGSATAGQIKGPTKRLATATDRRWRLFYKPWAFQYS